MAGQTYQYFVRASNSSGTKDSPTISVSIPADICPSGPGSFTLSNDAPICDTAPPAAPAVTLNWSASSGATSYQVYRNNSAIGNPTTGRTFYNNLGLVAGQTYQYFVRASNSSGTKDSPTISVSIPANICASGPGSFTLSNNSPICDTAPPAAPAVTLNWSASSGATSYQVYRNNSAIGNPTTGRTFYNNLGLVAGQTYQYFVRASNSSGTKDSPTISVAIPADICGIPLPPSLSIQAVSDKTATSAKLNGTVNPRGYQTTWRFEFGLTTSYGNSIIWSTAGAGTAPVSVSQPISALQPNTIYHYRLVAQNAIGPSSTEDQTFQTLASSFANLVIDSVAFSPSSVVVGNNVNVSTTIRNVGNAATKATHGAIFLSTDNTITLSDTRLSSTDFAIGPLGMGESATIAAAVTIPKATSQGTYFIAALIDENNEAGQSDRTDDKKAASQPLQVSAISAQKPVIVNQSESRVYNAVPLQPVSLSVYVSNDKDVDYQWYRDGLKQNNGTSASLPITPLTSSDGKYPVSGGTYYVDVWNDYGHTQSDPIEIIVQNDLGDVCYTIPDPGGAFLWRLDSSGLHHAASGTFAANLPTMLLVHGWQPNGTYSTFPPDTFLSLARVLTNRLWQSDNVSANVLLYTWPGAYFGADGGKQSWCLGVSDDESFRNAQAAGADLATWVQKIFPASYSKPIHIVGHSHGTVVGAVAISRLPQFEFSQVTVLDSPFETRAMFSPQLLINAYNNGTVNWVENFYAQYGYSKSWRFSDRLSGAAPCGGDEIPEVDHTGIVDWYLRFANNDDFISCVFPSGNFDYRPAPTFWGDTAASCPLAKPVKPYPTAVGVGYDPYLWLPKQGGVELPPVNVNGQTMLALEMRAHPIAVTAARRAANTMATTGAETPSLAQLVGEFLIPKDAGQLEFELTALSATTGDVFSVKLEDDTIFLCRISDYVGDKFQHIVLPISGHEGSVARVLFELSAQSTSSAARVANIVFTKSAINDSKTADFDGDGRSDIACYYPLGGNWYVFKSGEGFWNTTFGYEGTLPVSGDFDGDGKGDIGCYYPPGGNWYLYQSTDGFTSTQFGYAGTIPVVGDFDGDGKSDIGCYYPPGGNWYLFQSTDGFKSTQFGYAGTIPVVGDFDGDGKSDIGCYYPPGGNWYLFQSTDGFTAKQFGYAGTEPVVGDFDGDGKSDIGCYYPPGGNWYMYQSTDGFKATQFGYTGTTPVVGDYDGDGKSDIGCYYPKGGNWYIFKSTEGFWQTQFGYEGTLPVK